MIKNEIDRLISNRRTLLGVGPMSVNCVDASIELANEHNLVLMLIASRRQIDSADFGGGYVNNWSTDEFARYVNDKDKKGKVILARDHGGPWQNPLEVEKNYGLRQAMESAKLSFSKDIDAGFQFLHIDPSIDIHGEPNLDEILDRIYELYEFCWSYAQRSGRKLIFEIGTEEQSGSTNTIEELDYTLSSIKTYCQTNKMPPPSFVVMQTGTRVMETHNLGSYDSPLRVPGEIPPEIQIPKMVELCNQYGIYMKVHNTDYLSDEALKWYPRLGLHSANVAPEFGVAETRALISLLEENNLAHLSDRFLELAFLSNKWEKWMLKDTQTSDRDKSIIAGHYVFATEECIEIMKEAELHLSSSGVDLNNYLKDQVKLAVKRYLKHFRMITG